MENKCFPYLFLSINTKENSCSSKITQVQVKNTSAATEACHRAILNHYAHFSDGYIYLGLSILLTPLGEPGQAYESQRNKYLSCICLFFKSFIFS